jgi:hypothetical protein
MGLQLYASILVWTVHSAEVWLSVRESWVREGYSMYFMCLLGVPDDDDVFW